MSALKRVLPIVAGALLFLLVIALLVYLVDFLVIRHRIAKNLAPYGNVTTQTYYVIPHKDRKNEYVFLAPENEVCVHSLFPQNGKRPCWYAVSHNTKEIAP